MRQWLIYSGDTSSVTFGDSFPSKGKPPLAVHIPISALTLMTLPLCSQYNENRFRPYC